MNFYRFLITSFLVSIGSLAYCQTKPNILLIIADDMGIDVTNGYQQNANMPTTPTLDSLRVNGLTFTNTWSTPQCTPTRSAIMSGKYGIQTGVMRPPGNLDLEHKSLFTSINETTDNAYATAVIGKWHISNPVDYTHPQQHGIDHYEGLFTAFVDDYFNWEKIVDGQPTQVNEYVTTNLTNSAIEWVGEQEKPWFLWLAHVAPHSPFHVPPTNLFTTPNTSSQQGKYIAAIEAMDTEIGRLLASMDAETLKNTLIVVVGDNGTPKPVIQYYPDTHTKSTIYEGGIRVPMFISGYGVSRSGETEAGLTQLTDLYATLLEITGTQVSGGIHNSLSLKPALSCENMINRVYNYTDYQDGNTQIWAIRTDQYKLIEDQNGVQEFYDISVNPLEEVNLINNLTPEQLTIKKALETQANDIRSGWSCQDGIQNGTETAIDNCNDNCTNNNDTSSANIGCCEIPSQPSVFYASTNNDTRTIYTNNFPNHAYCYNPNLIPEQTHYIFNIDQTPAIADQVSQLTRANGRPEKYFGIALNGVLLVPVPAQPFIFENPNTGQYNWDWVFEPTNNQGEGSAFVSLDCASAHTGPQGYHYHGNMYEYMETILPNITTASEAPNGIIPIGWASDGFPILYRFGPDQNGNIKELLPSFQLRKGLREGDGITAPCGSYNGKYTRDYEYICGKGDLDECNGVARTIEIETSSGTETFDYFYVITSAFPQIPRCLRGTPSPDFANSNTPLTGVDDDGDGFLSPYDCDDNDPMVNPLASETIGNSVDENCDGILTDLRPLHHFNLMVSQGQHRGEFEVLSTQSEKIKVTVFSPTGQQMASRTSIGSVKFKNFKAGVYLLKINLENGSELSSKVMVQ